MMISKDNKIFLNKDMLNLNNLLNNMDMINNNMLNLNNLLKTKMFLMNIKINNIIKDNF